MKKTLLFALTLLLVSSCSALKDFTSRERRPLDVEIIQTLNKNEVLAVDNKLHIVKLESFEETYYDGKRIKGNFFRIGVYTYETKDKIQKTVPVYMRLSEYRKLKKNNQIIELQNNQSETTTPVF